MGNSKPSTTEEPKFIPSFLKNEDPFGGADETENGLCLNNVYIPEEIILHILSYLDPKDLLKHSLVCHKWNNVIKSYALWSTIYKRKYNRKAKKLPWYLYYCYLSTNYFDTNLLLNGNGQDKFNNWQFKADGGDKCKIEDPPAGADPLPLDIPDFCNKTSCFATSYGTCFKVQQINLGNSKLFQYILDSYKPHIYLSEWTAGRFDCGCIYKLQCGFIGNDVPKKLNTKPYGIHRVEQWQGSKWEKVEITVTEYPEGVQGILFEHEGRDTQYWAGNYGSKMAGGVVKLLFDTMEPLPTNKDGNEEPKMFSEIRFTSNGDQHNANERFGMWHENFDNDGFHGDDVYDEEWYSEQDYDSEDHDSEEHDSNPDHDRPMICIMPGKQQ